MAARMAVRRAAGLRTAAAARLSARALAPLYNSGGGHGARGVASVKPAQERRPFEHAAWSVAGSLAAASALALGAAAPTESEAAPTESEGEGDSKSGYKVNPIQNVTALLRLYDEIDKNMSVLAGRLLEDLERSLAAEAQQAAGSFRPSPEQRALDMSLRFEATLEKVQDAVFRNHYVTKAQVQEALERLARGELRGAGPAGAVSVAEADAIAEFVRKLGRLRWLCTGSREPLVPAAAARRLPDERPALGADAAVRVMQELVPALTREMEALVAELRALRPPLEPAAFQQELSRQYLARSGERTARVCDERGVDVREFQRALLFYHDDPALAQALAELADAQQRKFRELGLF